MRRKAIIDVDKIALKGVKHKMRKEMDYGMDI
jgi:hypothetical protein